jgi:hypothetical protein
MDKVDRLINVVRNLKEEGGMSIANSLGGGEIAGTVEAGNDPPVDLRKGKRRNWNPFFKDLARMQRRKPPQ